MKQNSARSLILVAVPIVLGALLALAGSQTNWFLGQWPAFAVAVTIAFAVQWVAYIPAVLYRTDRYFDATGSATYFTVTLVLLLLAPSLDLRQVVLGVMVLLWALRLGSFLFVRNLRSGGDDRFDEIKNNPLRFLSVWTIQGLWVSLTASAAWIAISSSNASSTEWTIWVGGGIWLIGFTIETVADWQKSHFKRQPENTGTFIQSGLWSVVRHPNYLGEITLWIGVFVVAIPALHGWQWVAVLSPLFVIFLLTKVSGIPLLETKAARKWGDEPDYQRYVARTPRLIPFTGKR